MLSTVLFSNNSKSNNLQYLCIRGPRILLRVLENKLPGRILQNSKRLFRVCINNFKPTGYTDPNCTTCRILLLDPCTFWKNINLNSLDFLQHSCHYNYQITCISHCHCISYNCQYSDHRDRCLGQGCGILYSVYRFSLL